MRLTLKILESSSEIQSRILKALLPEINKLFSKIQKPLQNNIREIVTTAIISSPEYASLLSGKLRSELGVPNADSRINQIFNIWFSNIQTKFDAPKISGSKIVANFSISLIKSDLSDVLSSDVAVIIDSFSGSVVNWLEWLSVSGDKTIIKNYDVVLGPNRRSRTGNAVMKVSANKRWKVPSEFSGTVNNNWVTRAIDGASAEIESLLSKTLKEAI